MCLVIVQGNEHLHVRVVNTTIQDETLLPTAIPGPSGQVFRGSAPLRVHWPLQLRTRNPATDFIPVGNISQSLPAQSRTEQLCGPQMATSDTPVCSLSGDETNPAL